VLGREPVARVKPPVVPLSMLKLASMTGLPEQFYPLGLFAIIVLLSVAVALPPPNLALCMPPPSWPLWSESLRHETPLPLYCPASAAARVVPTVKAS
jgi:hypothetical protein